MHLRIDIGILLKYFRKINVEKVNAVGWQGKASKSYNSDLEKEAKYLDLEL